MEVLPFWLASLTFLPAFLACLRIGTGTPNLPTKIIPANIRDNPY